MDALDQSSRRKFIKAGGILIATTLIGNAGNVFAKEEEKKENEVSPPRI